MQVPGGSSGASSGAALLAAIGTLLMTDRASGRVRCLASGCIDPDIDIRQGITRTCGATVQPDGLHVNNLCGPGYFCNDKKVCERAGLPGVGCQTSLQCLPGMTCENEVCVVTRLPGDSCEGDADCSYHNGQCIGNRCAGLGTGDGCSTRDTPQRCDKGLVCVSDVVKIYEDGLRGRGPDANMQILNGHGGVTSVNASNDTARGPGSLPLDGVCRAMLYPPASCDPRLLTDGVCAPGISVCMESAAGAGDWTCRDKYSIANKPSKAYGGPVPDYMCGEEIYSVYREVQGNGGGKLEGNWSSLGADIHSTRRTECLKDVTCSIGQCASLCTSGFGTLSGHRVAFRPADVLTSDQLGLSLTIQNLGRSSFVQTDITQGPEERSALKYLQVLPSGSYGSSFLFYDFEAGAWKIGTGLETATGLLMQVETSVDEIDSLPAGTAWQVWTGSTWLSMPSALRLVTTGLQRECFAVPALPPSVADATCSSSADCGQGGSCSKFETCSDAQDAAALLDLSNFSSAGAPVWAVASPLPPSEQEPWWLDRGVASRARSSHRHQRRCEQREASVSMSSPLPFDEGDTWLQAQDRFKAFVSDAELSACVWKGCGQTAINPGAYFLKQSFLPDDICQRKCKAAWCTVFAQPLAASFGHLGCSVTHLSTDCQQLPYSPDFSWILPVALGVGLLVVAALLGWIGFNFGLIRRHLRQRQERWKAAQAQAAEERRKEQDKLRERNARQWQQQVAELEAQDKDGEKISTSVDKDTVLDVRAEARKKLSAIFDGMRTGAEPGGEIHQISSSSQVAVWETHRKQALVDLAKQKAVVSA